MSNVSKILGLAAVIGLVGCLANDESSTLTATTRQCLTATSGEAYDPVRGEDDVPLDPCSAEPFIFGKVAFDSNDGDTSAARMPNIKNPDLSK